jgi:hypothetical protein
MCSHRVYEGLWGCAVIMLTICGQIWVSAGATEEGKNAGRLLGIGAVG